ncbi:hypothetical protein RB2654_13670 [Rhodobacterales bacterium HTCC2654]|uniref:Uncharacterized protein n=1 Tax=Maritimibacter alkaliphilus HTCC2654 TaxID=314271 RepID=A3VGD3_9RHOB|nr:hypothetical protein RB2654_13670 [Rhodobacterales bacterium HTCC2654] [Maritimibacter alkaliphilus HTCC2654]
MNAPGILPGTELETPSLAAGFSLFRGI